MPNISVSSIKYYVLGIMGIFLIPFSHVYAQAEISYVYENIEAEAQPGDILVISGKGFSRTNIPYNNKLFGVLQEKPLAVYKNTDGKGKPVARHGIAEINVTDVNGSINAGDYITSSEISGKGQKATQSGYVIGTALKSLENQKEGKITVALNIEYAEISSIRSFSRFLDYFNADLLRNTEDPEKFTQVLRYIGATIAVVLGFLIGLITISRSIPKAIEAMGRNPLASKPILISIILSIVLTVLTGSIGIITAIVILRL